MPSLFRKRNRGSLRNREIDPDEIFLDSKNLPEFDQDQFEGRLKRPLSVKSVVGLGIVFVAILLAFVGKISILQIKDGEVYAQKSADNSLRQTVIFPERGIIYDRNGVSLAWNIPPDSDIEYSKRQYAAIPGMGHVVGYVRYPSKDANGFYFQAKYDGVDGVEKIYNDALAGANGLKIVETDALGHIQSESQLEPPSDGQSLALSIDSRVQEELYNKIKSLALSIGFSGGAGVIMDVRTGEIITAVSYPGYDSNIMSDRAKVKEIQGYINDSQDPFLDRTINGLYTPGSIVKPFIALAALKEGVIDPSKQILSTGSISIPNPYNPKLQSVFKDWRPQGYVDMRHAIAVSSDVYFYEVGGGFQDQPGLGIDNIDKYMKLFGFGTVSPSNPFLDMSGTVPSPGWKAENFPGDPWRIGDTYNTSIGQYGWEVTPMQVARAVSAIANGGTLIEPTFIKAFSDKPSTGIQLPFSPDQIAVVQQGMRLAVTGGIAVGLNIPQVAVAAKTGTAELGAIKKYVNSWVEGFFPYDHPRYAFAAIMEKGPYSNTVGALYVMRGLFEWMAANTPEYFK